MALELSSRWSVIMTIAEQSSLSAHAGLDLHSGDRMDREEFHRLYEQAPRDFRAELIGGIVFVSSPLSRRHGIAHPPLSTVLFAYEASTAGTECGDNATLLLGDDAEPQPDLYLRILPEYGGQSTTKKDYVNGAPEFVAEIALSSRSIDLHAKRDDYTRHGVLEYLVVSLREQQLYWFDLRARQELSLDADGICRIRTFPGLWVDSAALLRRDFLALMATLQKGLATPEHADFVARMAAARQTP
jgi:Uma2 family endonuclease